MSEGVKVLELTSQIISHGRESGASQHMMRIEVGDNNLTSRSPKLGLAAFHNLKLHQRGKIWSEKE